MSTPDNREFLPPDHDEEEYGEVDRPGAYGPRFDTHRIGDTEPTPRDVFIEEIIEWLESGEPNATLRGKAHDVGKPEGRRAYAEWLADECIAVLKYHDRTVQ
jgi:hypothetical protein